MHKVLVVFVLVLWTTSAFTIEKRPLEEVDPDAFTTETQANAAGGGDDHVAIVWWIPNEFWESILLRDPTMNPTDRQAMFDALEGISLLVVVQADISRLGAFQFYSKEEIERNLTIAFTEKTAMPLQISPIQDISADLQLVLNIFKPILGSAMGNLGNNMHFYVLDDNGPGDSRILDPYEGGNLQVSLENRLQKKLEAKIELPINALYVPRICPNGKDAHVTWNFCPWGGEKLKD